MLRSLPLWLAVVWAADGVPPAVDAVAARVMQIRADAVPVAPELASLCRRLRAACPGHGGPRTQTGAAFPVSGGLATNAHVVAGARRVQLVDAHGEVSTVEPWKVRVDADRDLAWVPVGGMAPLTWSGTELVHTPADEVRAWTIGFPDDGPRAVHDTTLGALVRWAFGAHPPHAYRRFAGPVRSGESGGPMVDAHGELLGVVVAGSTASSELAGDGLAIPIEVAHPILDALAASWDVNRRVGIRVVAAADPPGWTVAAVTPGSPAAAAGLVALDRILEVDGDPASPAQLARRAVLGARQVWSVRRDGTVRSVQVQAEVPLAPTPLAVNAPLIRRPDGLYSLSPP